MFKINIKHQFVLGEVDAGDESVAEAISSTYSEYTHDIEVNWGSCAFALDRRGDLSEIYNDLVLMLTKLENREEKEFSISFLSSTFTAVWNLSIRDDLVLIEPKWIVVGFINTDSKEMDFENNKIEVPISYFIEEWNSLLRYVKKDMLSLGYKNNLENFDYLEHI